MALGMQLFTLVCASICLASANSRSATAVTAGWLAVAAVSAFVSMLLRYLVTRCGTAAHKSRFRVNNARATATTPSADATKEPAAIAGAVGCQGQPTVDQQESTQDRARVSSRSWSTKREKKLHALHTSVIKERQIDVPTQASLPLPRHGRKTSLRAQSWAPDRKIKTRVKTRTSGAQNGAAKVLNCSLCTDT